MIIQVPAPEEARTYKDFVLLFKARNPGFSISDAAQLLGRNMKQFFDEAWRQPEAEEIHAEYQRMQA